MSSNNQTVVSVALQFPATIPTYINAFEVVPLEPDLVQIDMGFLDIYNLPQASDGKVQPQGVSRVVMTSERTHSLILELQKALELQENIKTSSEVR